MSQSAFKEIIVTGSISRDEIMNFPGTFKDYFLPSKLHQINVSFVVDSLEQHMGGTATNIAYNLSLVSELPIKIFGAVGKDGNDFLDFFAQRSIDASCVLMDESTFTATGKAITDINDNQIWGFYYGASSYAKHIDLSRCAGNESLLILTPTHMDAFFHFQRYAIEKHIAYMYDPGMALTMIDSDSLRNGVEHCTWLVGNDYEMAKIYEITGYSEDQLVELGKRVITTLGGKGVRYIDGVHRLSVEGVTLDTVVDPTGAGDAWRGGFIGALADGKELDEALRYANALASFAVEVYGTIRHTPSRDEVQARAEGLSVLSIE